MFLQQGILLLIYIYLGDVKAFTPSYSNQSLNHGSLRLMRKNPSSLIQTLHGINFNESPFPLFSAIDPMVTGVGTIAAVSGAVIWFSATEDRARKKKYAEWDAKNKLIMEERAQKAYIEPREAWTESQLSKYDGSKDEDGPILFAADGDVYNVWKGRHFYGPGCEYHLFAGKDATRLLAKSLLEPETPEQMEESLTIAEKVALQGWIYTFKSKYEIVGRLKAFDPTTTKF